MTFVELVAQRQEEIHLKRGNRFRIQHVALAQRARVCRAPLVARCPKTDNKTVTTQCRAWLFRSLRAPSTHWQSVRTFGSGDSECLQ